MTGAETSARAARAVQQADQLQAEEQPGGGCEELRPAGDSDPADWDSEEISGE